MSKDNKDNKSPGLGQENATPGAGVDPKKVINKRNRLIKAWRNSETKLSLKAWARELHGSESPDWKLANDWLYRKSAAFTAEARKERKSRVRVAQAASRANRPDKKRSKRQ